MKRCLFLVFILLCSININAQGDLTGDGVAALKIDQIDGPSNQLLLRGFLSSDALSSFSNYNDAFLTGTGLDLTFIPGHELMGFAKLGFGINLNFRANDGLGAAINRENNFFFQEKYILAPRMTFHFDFGLKNIEFYTGADYQFVLTKEDEFHGYYCPCCGPPRSGGSRGEEGGKRGENIQSSWSSNANFIVGTNVSFTPRFGAFTEFGRAEAGSLIKAGLRFQILKI